MCMSEKRGKPCVIQCQPKEFYLLAKVNTRLVAFTTDLIGHILSHFAFSSQENKRSPFPEVTKNQVESTICVHFNISDERFPFRLFFFFIFLKS